ncbi:uncharacterized mitochondrial protein AtMg00710-like [Nicotiana sylvestris]|uniref:uncharacterized mitochondrial protein AtMg00710-like n=1 Tax=Nicotiana sylvestris TaxID=4096 RepID=UPI00388CA934
MKSKDEVLGIFLKWKTMVDNQTGRRIKCIRTNNGGEYKNDHFNKNGVAERMNRTLLEKVRYMLSNAGLDKEFWVEIITYAYHLINHFPSAAINGKTPFEKWYGNLAIDYDSLHAFGSTAYYHVTASKLDPRAKKTIFMGITSGVKGYRLWYPNDKESNIQQGCYL